MRNFLSVFLTLVFVIFTMEISFSQTERGHSTRAGSNESEATASYVTGLTSARARSLVGTVLALVSVVIGWRVKRRSAVSPGGQRPWAITALVMGVIAVALSLLHLLNTSGGFGTGGGKAGAIVGMVVGVIGSVLSLRALRVKRG